MTNIATASKSFHRVSLADIEPIWQAAELLLKPEESTQRKVFESLMPYLYALRHKGCSWKQITDLVIKSGLNLQPSTVRTYYSEMLASRQDACQARMTEQILLMGEIKKSQASGEQSALKAKLDEILRKQPSVSPSATTKIDAIFGVSGAARAAAGDKSNGPQIFDRPRPDQQGNLTQTAQTKLSPPAAADAPTDKSDFGLLNTGKSKVRSTSFLPITDAPSIPSLLPGISDTPLPVLPLVHNRVLRCMPLQPGVRPLPTRPGVAPECYKPGRLEHPAVEGLMLSLEDRLYSAALEFVCADDTTRLESLDEKRFRIKWKKPIALTKSSTDGDFTPMDDSIFKQS